MFYSMNANAWWLKRLIIRRLDDRRSNGSRALCIFHARWGEDQTVFDAVLSFYYSESGVKSCHIWSCRVYFSENVVIFLSHTTLKNWKKWKIENNDEKKEEKVKKSEAKSQNLWSHVLKWNAILINSRNSYKLIKNDENLWKQEDFRNTINSIS